MPRLTIFKFERRRIFIRASSVAKSYGRIEKISIAKRGDLVSIVMGIKIVRSTPMLKLKSLPSINVSLYGCGDKSKVFDLLNFRHFQTTTIPAEQPGRVGSIPRRSLQHQLDASRTPASISASSAPLPVAAASSTFPHLVHPPPCQTPSSFVVFVASHVWYIFIVSSWIITILKNAMVCKSAGFEIIQLAQFIVFLSAHFRMLSGTLFVHIYISLINSVG